MYRCGLSRQPACRLAERCPTYLFIQEPGGAFALVVGAIGANLALTNWAGLALAVGVPLFGHLPRIGVEERAMAGALGNEW